MNPNINDSFWMKIAKQVAEAGTCQVKVGCVIIKKNEISGIGFVGSVKGDDHCLDKGCLLVDNYGLKGSSDTGKSCIRTVHAELNAVLRRRMNGDEETGWMIAYCTHQPCLECTKALLAIGVRGFVYEHPYKDIYRDLYLKEVYSGKEIIRIKKWPEEKVLDL